MKMDDVLRMRHELRQEAQKEAIKWFRIARRALAHGCSDKLVSAIREEAFIAHDTLGCGYPERMLNIEYMESFRYCFK